MRRSTPSRHAVPAVLALLLASVASAAETDEEELALAYGDPAMVSIATGRQQDLSRAPAVASVITAADIEAMGATELEQVLARVPGLHVSVNHFTFTPIYSFRGIFTAYNSQVLVLVNGIPITNAFLGNRGTAWGGMPLENISRIEVIRGPGSALYGADAFAGVINIITKTAAEIDGTQVGLRAGSFDSQEAWLQQGSRQGQLEMAFYVRVGHTDGHQPVIEQDLQSILDGLFQNMDPSIPAVSLAPGRASTERYAADARADLAYGPWRLRAAYQGRELGSGAGLAESLDPKSRGEITRRFVDLSYQSANLVPDWELAAVAGFYDVREVPGEQPFMLFPRGAFAGAFPEGVIGNAGHAERHSHVSLTAFFTGFLQHRLRLGAGYRLEDMYETTETKNYRIELDGDGNPVFVHLGGTVDVSGTPDVFLTPHRREITYAFAQDEWSLAPDWTLTTGLRHDHYSDFGGTTNPRVALVWDAAYNLVVKALHGRAFRAPSFAEQYNINNPVTLGNPGLEPETIETSELAFAWQPRPALHTDLSLFHYHMRDIIRFVPGDSPASGVRAQNVGSQTGHGLELEGRWDTTNTLRLTGNVSLQRAIDGTTDKEAGLAPRQRYFAQADWRFAPQWQLGTTLNHVADRKRQTGDNRPEIDDYTTLDLSLRRDHLFGNGEVRATLLNVFDADAREPSLAPGNIVRDLPLPGRAFYVQLQYSL